jgi:hypothetical protein
LAEIRGALPRLNKRRPAWPRAVRGVVFDKAFEEPPIFVPGLGFLAGTRAGTRRLLHVTQRKPIENSHPGQKTSARLACWHRRGPPRRVKCEIVLFTVQLSGRDGSVFASHRRLVNDRSYADIAGAWRARDGARASRTVGRATSSLGSRQPIRELGIPTRAERSRHRMQHESERRVP